MWDGVSQGASEPVWTWCFIAQSALGQLLFQVSEPNETVEKGLREIGVADGW
ncbi:hypothetical protein SPHINGOT1_300016 [Sphingomonas sp. T1]|nr:hypothetical protein SPHINGOT1_300016 [Sphingomonas sp. T1]